MRDIETKFAHYLAQLTKKEREQLLSLSKEDTQALLDKLKPESFYKALGDLKVSFGHNPLESFPLALDDDGLLKLYNWRSKSYADTVNINNEIKGIPVTITLKIERKVSDEKYN